MFATNTDARAIIKNGSKSFSLASLFFSADQEMAAARLYHWCRHCDDLIDKDGVSDEEFNNLVQKTTQIWSEPNSIHEGAFKDMAYVVHQYQIPQKYALDMLEGMRMDLVGTHYRSLEDLKTYCYHVASTVGLMMTHVMGVFRTEALSHAAQLGVAMQLTNICRDVKEDFEMGRIYLPYDLLEFYQVETTNIIHPAMRSNLFNVVKTVIEESEYCYYVGKKGIIDLPLRAALVITFASRLYREINQEILRRGEESIETRVIVPFHRKILIFLLSTIEVSATLPKRFMREAKVLKELPVWDRL